MEWSGGRVKTGLDNEDVHQKEVRESKEPGGTEDTILSKSQGVRGEVDLPGQIVQSLPEDLDFT